MYEGLLWPLPPALKLVNTLFLILPSKLMIPIPQVEKMNFSEPIAMAQRQGFDPWTLPDSFTLANYVPDDVRSFLLPHWHSFKALHPMWYYVMGLYYLVMGKFCRKKIICLIVAFDIALRIKPLVLVCYGPHPIFFLSNGVSHLFHF